MIFSRELNCCPMPAACIAIGSFDGVHIGHQSLIRQMTANARALGVPPVVVTFYPQPVVLFRNIKNDFYISTLPDRRALIESLGVQAMVTLPFTRELAQVSAFEFLKQLHQHFGLLHLWVGEEFTLGSNREGTVERITQIGAELGFTVHAIERVTLDGEIVSSGRIRDALRAGDLPLAERMLGRTFTMQGMVVHGAHRGRTIGYPTANLQVDPLLVHLRKGVYQTTLTLEGVPYPAITSVGTNPTFVHTENPPLTVETFILDFERDIYDKMVQIEFLHFIRDEHNFSSVQDLIRQIELDVDVVRGRQPHDQTAPGVSTRPAEPES